MKLAGNRSTERKKVPSPCSIAAGVLGMPVDDPHHPADDVQHGSIPSRSWTGEEADPLNDAALLEQLEELADRIQVAVRYENITGEDSPASGGLCRIQGRYVVIVHSRATLAEKIRVVAKALRQFDFSEIYVRPALRELLERSGKEQ